MQGDFWEGRDVEGPVYLWLSVWALLPRSNVVCVVVSNLGIEERQRKTLYCDD